MTSKLKKTPKLMEIIMGTIKVTAGMLNDVKTIYITLMLVIGGICYSADNRYMLKEDGIKLADTVELRSLNSKLNDLDIDLSFEQDKQKMRVLKAKKSMTVNKIKSILDEKEVNE